MDGRERRLAENEALFRDINERVQSIAAAHGSDAHRYAFFCECANADCTLQMELTSAEYESVRTDGRRFVVLPGHEVPDIERVVETRARYFVVQKVRGGAEVAAELDPRAT